MMDTHSQDGVVLKAEEQTTKQGSTFLSWRRRVLGFVESLRRHDAGGFASVPGGQVTLYGTCYALLTRYYLGIDESPEPQTRDFILGCQEPDEDCYFVGPELRGHKPPAGAKHDREHLLLHLACAVLPVMQQFGMRPRSSLRFAHRFCRLDYLDTWLRERDLTDAWLEGNNLLFVGQLLWYLREEERHPDAAKAMDYWFSWLDQTIDPRTGLWGTDGHCSPFVAMCGGYHQLLAYYHERRPVSYPERLVDTVLSLQHSDGGFAPGGGGGACEDVDAVDILVNLYKLFPYRRAAIRVALRRCARQIIGLQNSDGGFLYRRDEEHSHMGIPGTRSPANISALFPTWFRVHTLALLAEVLTDEPWLAGQPFRFNSAMSMGWHRPWNRADHVLSIWNSIAERFSIVGSTVFGACRTMGYRAHRGQGVLTRRSFF
jgi:hypothetical protein